MSVSGFILVIKDGCPVQTTTFDYMGGNFLDFLRVINRSITVMKSEDGIQEFHKVDKTRLWDIVREYFYEEKPKEGVSQSWRDTINELREGDTWLCFSH